MHGCIFAYIRVSMYTHTYMATYAHADAEDLVPIAATFSRDKEVHHFICILRGDNTYMHMCTFKRTCMPSSTPACMQTLAHAEAST